MKGYLRVVAGTLLALALLLVGTINLGSVPPLGWDEGWTLTVARTWVEQGHYGRLLAGQLAPPGLEAAFPVTASIALSFRLLGIGVWQGRLVGVFFTLGALALICYLASRLYDRSVAIGTLAVLLLMSPYHSVHPVLIGRQVLGDIPALFYLLGGYVCFLSALRKPLWFLLAAVGLWGTALITKAQVLPFWAASLLVPLSIMLFRCNWRPTGLLGMGLLGSFIVSRLLLWLQQLVLRNHTMPTVPIHGLYDVTVFVPVVTNRVFALIVVLEFGLPTLLGLCYTAWRFINDRDKAVLKLDLEIVRLALLTLAGSWFGWYVCLSNGATRYFFPPVFLGGIFVAALLHDLTDHFSLSSTIERGGYALRYLRFNWHGTGALLATILIALTVPATLRMLYRSYVVSADASALQVADLFNTQIAPNALVETYDSELFFLLNRRYHYPPDQLHVELIRRSFLGQLGQGVPIVYDPLAADPDYLVVGPYSKDWWLYDSVLATGAFRLLRVYSRYAVYERVRHVKGERGKEQGERGKKKGEG